MKLQKPILTVSQLNHQIKNWLEYDIGDVHVEGEISNLSKATSGHFYFSLKDANAQLRCVYFRNYHQQNNQTTVTNGQHIHAQGKLSIYEARGDYQLIVEHINEAGQGDLFKQFEQLKNKLSALGLFDPIRKKQSPKFPQMIGIITSPQAAALQDILATIGRRYPLADIIIYASDVQGKQAPGQLINAIRYANLQQQAEVLILARGGGSMEDLWAFNDENLALAIASSKIPIIAGIGHETDFTIADFVADLRATTPTAAAESATPNKQELINLLTILYNRMIIAMRQLVERNRLTINHQLAKICSRKQLLITYWQNIDYLVGQLNHNINHLIIRKTQIFKLITIQLAANNPLLLMKQANDNMMTIKKQLIDRMNHHKERLQQNLRAQMATLHAVSPLATLERGYAIVTNQDKIIDDSTMVSSGDLVSIRVARGVIDASVV